MGHAPDDALLFASLAADNAAPFYRALVEYLSETLRVPMRLLDEVPWEEREQRLYRGQAHLGVVCGLQYVYACERAEQPGVELLAAPIMSGQRYAGRPIYFSDVVVRQEHPAGCLGDLLGTRYTYNEHTSQSGYGIVRYALAQRGHSAPFFGSVCTSGAHERSLDWILNGTVDASAIDSTVLETELRQRPELHQRVRVVSTLGPSPIPPLVVSRALPLRLREDLRAAVLTMDTTPHGRAVLAEGVMHRFVEVHDADYDPIRLMQHESAATLL
ncbi:MAG TPA: PhnD/SsuA/transferrin family substrate-binding protein [Chloroflexota bacterium]|jgi:phosphonate transport system substrate-binding protein